MNIILFIYYLSNLYNVHPISIQNETFGDIPTHVTYLIIYAETGCKAKITL